MGKVATPFLGPVDFLTTTAQARLLPIPMEATVTYGGGTARGPGAILEASREVELYDREFGCEPALHYGVETLAEMVLPSDPGRALEEIARRTFEVSEEGVLLGALGGEHSLTAGVVRGLLRRQPGPVTIVQIDAHCDLRDTYNESPHNHACVGRRLLELPEVEQLLQIGIRSLCREEAEFLAGEPRVRTWFSEDIHEGGWEAEFLERVSGKRVYLTIDVDGLDPSLIPATGTPEPNGLQFRQVEKLLKLMSGRATLIGFDCVELSPIEGYHACDFVVAKLVYRVLNLFLAKKTLLTKGIS